jgi:hypothetical protein
MSENRTAAGNGTAQENRTATHRHKTYGPVVLLESTAQLGKVLVVDLGDEVWVKLADLTEGAQPVKKKRAREPKDRPNSSANSSYRTVRAV